MRTVDVALKERSYKIHIGSNKWDAFAHAIRKVLKPGKLMLVSDDHVFPHYGAKVTALLQEAEIGRAHV